MLTRTDPRRIERAGPADLMFLAVQAATVPEQFGVVLLLDAAGGFDVAEATPQLVDRVRGVPRLRQRLRPVPPGCGAPVWVDDPSYAAARHVATVACPAPGDEQALLDAATRLLLDPLPLDRPLWAARFVTGLADGRAALVIVAQHALADGLGGLAVLGALLDGAPVPPSRPFPVPLPSRAELARDALGSRLRVGARLLRSVPHSPGPRRSPPRARERIGRAAPCSLLRPTGPGRRTAVARVPLAGLRASAHERGATVNDALVSALAGSLHTFVAGRGEEPPAFVLAVPVAMRGGATATDPGNAFTEARAAVRGGGDPVQRLSQVAAVMSARKSAAMSWPALLLAAPAVRAMVATGVYGWYLRRQRYLHTVLTNLRGPEQRVSLCGAPVTSMLPLAVGGGGNVTVTFAALSYAGELAVTVTADPDATPDLATLAAQLQTELDALAGAREPSAR